VPNRKTLLTVTDLHRSTALLEALRIAVIQHMPDVVALVGDFLHGLNDNAGRLTTEDCALFLAKLECPEILFVRGNHEDDAWLVFASVWKTTGRPLTTLHGEVFQSGPLTLVGFPCLMGDGRTFADARPELLTDYENWLPPVIGPVGSAARTLWLMHEPPTGTPLSQPGSVVEGNWAWAHAIYDFAPWLTISGHDHLTPIRAKRWYCEFQNSTCVNVGQSDHGPLHYCLVEAEFKGISPSLPTRLQVTAYPWQETISVSAGKATRIPAATAATAVRCSEILRK